MTTLKVAVVEAAVVDVVAVLVHVAGVAVAIVEVEEVVEEAAAIRLQLQVCV